MLFMTVDGQQQVGDEAGKDLHHQAVFAPSDEMVHLEVPFPPANFFGGFRVRSKRRRKNV